ncbi:hypothetical protein [Paenibacillus brevis]|uniref:Uncharacterized protein n=1 Tax=Paenibacillus brevis TaxID=2841508 RepID=A0ABS6FJB9_9BACL|nr:hypothetical protein [Paenibacillus brevis]MBU5670268.1 hypothetical protein [Paenibacillus brevis]
MEKFEYLKPAMRYIQSVIGDLEKVYLMSDYYQEQFFVTNDASKLEAVVDRDFYADPGDAEEHAECYKLWVFILGVEKTLYPNVYKRFKDTYVSGNHVRGEKKVVGEVQAIFTVCDF